MNLQFKSGSMGGLNLLIKVIDQITNLKKYLMKISTFTVHHHNLIQLSDSHPALLFYKVMKSFEDQSSAFIRNSTFSIIPSST